MTPRAITVQASDYPCRRPFSCKARCGHEYIARCPSVALSGEEGATCSEHALPGELDQFRDRHARVSKREAELHYAVRKDANILDHKMAENGDCDHGITFDQAEAERVLRETKEDGDPGVDFVMGPVNAVATIRKRWPRGFFTRERPCPKGCGYEGIYYASAEHYSYGDW